MPRPTLKADMLWGAKAGATLLCICCAPAAFAFMVSQLGSAPGEPIEAVRIFGAYLMFGAISGAVIGLCRPFASSAVGAILVGAVLGGSGFTSLMFLGDRPRHDHGLLVVAAAIGAPVGAFFGWYIRRRFGQPARPPPRQPRVS